MCTNNKRVWKAFISAGLVVTFFYTSNSQNIYSSLPSKIDISAKWLFYLHGAIVQDQGINAVSEDYGSYKYLDILDTLKRKGFEVVSEARPKNTKAEDYANKVSKQIDSLIAAKVPEQNIIVVGASSGGAIAMQVAMKLRKEKIKYAVMGLCWPYSSNDYRDKNFCGNFLSIYESSDPHGSCELVFDGRICLQFKEIKLNTGKSHGFLYQPYKEWVDPLVEWINSN